MPNFGFWLAYSDRIKMMVIERLAGEDILDLMLHASETGDVGVSVRRANKAPQEFKQKLDLTRIKEDEYNSELAQSIADEIKVGSR